MKEIIAIIRPKKVKATKDALEALGYPSFMALSVLGRGHQRGIAAEVACELPANLLGRSGGMKYVPKRMISVVVPDADEDQIVQTIIQINQTAQIGDGKVFVLPVEEAMRVRTDEHGDAAIL